MPGFAARMAFGEMADELLLASARVVPSKLEASGFVFRHPDLASALASLLGEAKEASPLATARRLPSLHKK
jgi:NAD dependent epimerase/dehydratase family enzyme